jgi:hypothetical protein
VPIWLLPVEDPDGFTDGPFAEKEQPCSTFLKKLHARVMDKSGLRPMRKVVPFGSLCIDSIQRQSGGGKEVSASGWRTNLSGQKITLTLTNLLLMPCRTYRVWIYPDGLQ